MKVAITVGLLLLSLSGRAALGAEWPLTTVEQDEILGRSNTFAASSPERQKQQREQLVAVFRANASVAAFHAYFPFLEKNYDKSKPEAEKRQILLEAEQVAKAAARANAVEWMNKAYSSGRKRPAASLVLEMGARVDVTARFHEWDKFLDDEGNLELRSGPFQIKVVSPFQPYSPRNLDERTAVDPYVLAEQNYGGQSPQGSGEETATEATPQESVEQVGFEFDGTH